MRRKKSKSPDTHNKAYKYRIYPTDEQEVLFAKTFGCTRFIYNQILYDSMAHYEATGEIMITPYARYKEKFEWLKEVDSLALANAQLNIEGAYARFEALDEHKHSKKKIEKSERTSKPLTVYDLEKHPKFKAKKDGHRSYTTNCVNGNIAVVNGKLKLPKVGIVEMKEHRSAPGGYVLKSVTVSRVPTGKYFAAIVYEYDQAIAPVDVGAAVGLDFSMASGYVDSEGGSAGYPQYYRKSEARLAREQRKLSRMVPYSSNWYKQNQKVNLVHERIANQRNDFLHKASRKIANSYDLVGVEDLNMRAMGQCLRFGKSVGDVGWGTFRRYVEYKLVEQGKHYVVIDKWYPSSKKCSTAGCGYTNDGLKLADREWECPKCGVRHDRDNNAAANIREEALRIHREGKGTGTA